MENIQKIKCSFCGAEMKEDEDLIKGKDSVYICKECTKIACQAFDLMPVQENYQTEPLGKTSLKKSEALKENKKEKDQIKILKPSEIYQKLNDYVIGQDAAKKTLAVAVYNHYKRFQINAEEASNIQKSNIMMVGPTGSGKTYLVKSLAKILDVPLAIVDATAMTATGYVGKEVDSMLTTLVNAANGDVKKAEHGIIYIDEIDKIRVKDTNGLDIGGESVQQAMLKLVEGTVTEVTGRIISSNEKVDWFAFGESSDEPQIDTSNILFICGGAFSGIENIINTRTNQRSSIGFGATINTHREINLSDSLKKLEVEDLKKFGMIPEFIGRFPVLIHLDELDHKALKRILIEPKDALIKQYQRLLKYDGVDIVFSEKAIKHIADQAIKNKTGARGLRSIMEQTMEDLMFSIPDEKNLQKIFIDENESGNLVPKKMYKKISKNYRKPKVQK